MRSLLLTNSTFYWKVKSAIMQLDSKQCVDIKTEVNPIIKPRSTKQIYYDMVGKPELTFFDQSKKSGTKMDDRFGPPQWQSTSSSSQAFTKEKKPSCQTVFFHPPSLARTLPTNFLTISLGFIASSNLFDVVFIRTGNSVQ